MNRKRAAWIAGISGAALIALVAILAANNRAQDRYAESGYATQSTGDEQSGQIGSSRSLGSEPTRRWSVRLPLASSKVMVPAGTRMSLVLGTSLSTKTADVGEPFEARVASPIYVNGRLAIPSGAHVTGHVAAVKQPGKASGRALMQLAFDRLHVGGRTYALNSVGPTMEGKSGAKKDAAMIGGGAIAGAVLGGVLGHGAGDAAKGAVIGGATGTAASLMTRGPQLKLEAGSTVSFTLDRSVSVVRSEARA